MNSAHRLYCLLRKSFIVPRIRSASGAFGSSSRYFLELIGGVFGAIRTHVQAAEVLVCERQILSAVSDRCLHFFWRLVVSLGFDQNQPKIVVTARGWLSSLSTPDATEVRPWSGIFRLVQFLSLICGGDVVQSDAVVHVRSRVIRRDREQRFVAFAALSILPTSCRADPALQRLRKCRIDGDGLFKHFDRCFGLRLRGRVHGLLSRRRRRSFGILANAAAARDLLDLSSLYRLCAECLTKPA
jgi:hypothetical protein